MGSSDVPDAPTPIIQNDKLPPRSPLGRRRPRPRHIVPEIGSLYDILHDHCHLSLYVLPICWTDFHAQILETRFLIRPPVTTPTPPSSQTPRRTLRTPQVVVSTSRNIDTLLVREKPLVAKNRAMQSILSTFYPEHLPKAGYISELPLRFGRKFYPSVARCQLLWNQADPNTSFDSATTWTASQSAGQSSSAPFASGMMAQNTPLLAYINRSHLDHVRRNCFRVLAGPNGQFNNPVYRLQVLRSKNLLPKNPDEDSYFVAVMLAMAQKSVYASVWAGTGFVPRDVKVRVLTVAEEDDAFMVYTGTVPGALLSMFHKPDVAPTSNREIKIEYCQVPVWPVLGFKERLGKALGADVVGSFEGVPMDCFGEETSPPMSSTRKRRREALAEVFNASFSEDHDSDSPTTVSEPFIKRRCGEKVRLGVVQ